MKFRKIIAIITALAMVLTAFSVSFAEEEDGQASLTSQAPAFTDLKDYLGMDHWAKAAIDKWSGYGIISGYEGKFRPDDSITRGELAVILDNMMDYQVAAKNTFKDLQAGEFYTDSVLKANAAGIITGYDGLVRPTDKITKEEAVVMFARAFAVDAAAFDKTKFLDAAAVSEWAQNEVFGLELAGYIKGAEGYFNPQKSITRAEVVTIIDNIVKAYYTAAGTYTDNVEGTAVIKASDVTLKGVTVKNNLIIAEGVGQGDVNLDSVTVKGQVVVRGGGENSVHIEGNSNITTVTVEKIGDKIRIVVSEGSTVSVVEVAAGEEIIVSGSVGTLQVDAPSVTVNAEAATINTVNVSGENATLNVGAKTAITNVNVSNTAANTTIQTQTGATISKVTSSAEVTVGGTGKVTNVTLNSGANGSSVTTPNTSTSVSSGVSGVTGGGGAAIPAGSTGTNNSSGTGTNVGTTPSGGGGGGGNDNDSPSPSLTLTEVTGPAMVVANGVYYIPYDGFTGAAVTVTAANYSSATDVTITVAKQGGATEFATVSVAAATLNGTHTSTVADLDTMLGLLAAIGGGNENYDGKLSNTDKFDNGDQFVVTIQVGSNSVSFTVHIGIPA